jgi:hypothetical protein
MGKAPLLRTATSRLLGLLVTGDLRPKRGDGPGHQRVRGGVWTARQQPRDGGGRYARWWLHTAASLTRRRC